MKVLFLHGYGSSPETDKYKAITSSIVEHKYCPYIEYNKISYLQLFVKLAKLIVETQPDLIIGHSLGGYWAKAMSNEYHIPCILLNPQLFPEKKFGYPDFSEEDFSDKGIWNYSYLETGDENIELEKTKKLLKKYTDLTVQEGGHHRIQFLDNINSIIEHHHHLSGIYD